MAPNVSGMDRSTFSSLSGGDAAVALRSLARRFRESFRPGELAGDAVAARRGEVPARRRALAARARRVGRPRASPRCGEAIEQVLVADDPVLPGRPARPGRRGTAPPASGAASSGALTGALDRLGGAAESLADRAQHVSLKDWGRTGRVGAGTVSAIELVQEAVATGRTYLDQLGPALDGVRRSPE